MANPLNLAEEINFSSLFNRASIHPNNRDAVVSAQSDEQKYAAGIGHINQNYAALYNSLGQPRSQVRNPVHALSRGFVVGKGIKGLEGQPFRFWCVTFDLYNRGDPKDPNGPRRLIAVLENWPGGTSGGRTFYTSDGGYYRHLVYSNNHYGDRGKGPSLAYVKGWPLAGFPAGIYSAMGSIAATFA